MNNRVKIAHEFANAINSDRIIRIILFGSVARGDDSEDSDIDILIISNHREDIEQKIDDEIATLDDVYAVQKNWLNKKKVLHIFIPHNEIKEIDLWLAETVTLVRDKEWTDAISKVEVLIELSEQIPNTFRLKWENIL